MRMDLAHNHVGNIVVWTKHGSTTSPPFEPREPLDLGLLTAIFGLNRPRVLGIVGGLLPWSALRLLRTNLAIYKARQERHQLVLDDRIYTGLVSLSWPPSPVPEQSLGPTHLLILESNRPLTLRGLLRAFPHLQGRSHLSGRRNAHHSAFPIVKRRACRAFDQLISRPLEH